MILATHFELWDYTHLASVLVMFTISILSLAIVVFGIRNTECARQKCEFSVSRNNERISWGLLIFLSSLPLLAIYAIQLFFELDEAHDVFILHLGSLFELFLYIAIIWSLYYSLCKELKWCGLFAYGKDIKK